MAAGSENEALKDELRALQLVAESIRNSFIEARHHGLSPAFSNELGYFIPIIQQLLLVQTSDVHESEQFAAVTHLIGQCYPTLDSVASRLSRAANGEVNDKRRSLLLRSYIKEQLQDEIEGLKDMISKNISAVSTMLSIRNITRTNFFEIGNSPQETIQTSRRSSAASLLEFNGEEKTLRQKSNERHPRRASKVVRFESLPGLQLPPPIYPRQGPLGLSDVVANIEFLADRLDLESQATLQKSTREGRGHLISLLAFWICFFVGLVPLLYFGIGKHDLNTGIGIMGTLMSVYSILDHAIPLWHRRRAFRLEKGSRS